MKQLIATIILAATAVTVQAETVTVFAGTNQGIKECINIQNNLTGLERVHRAGLLLYRKDNKYINLECPLPTMRGDLISGKIVVYTEAEIVQLDEAYMIKQRQSAEQQAIKSTELLKKYGI